MASIKLRHILISLFLLSIAFTSCKNEKEYKATFLIDNEEINISESYFYVNQRGTVFYYISDDSLRNQILKNGIINEIKFSFTDSIRTAKPFLDSMSSHKLPESSFFFLVNKDTKKAMIDTVEHKTTIIIISSKTDINNLIGKGILKAIKIRT